MTQEEGRNVTEVEGTEVTVPVVGITEGGARKGKGGVGLAEGALGMGRGRGLTTPGAGVAGGACD